MGKFKEWRFRVVMIDQHGEQNIWWEDTFDFDPRFKIEALEKEIERLRARLAAIAALENGLFDPPIRPFVDVLGDALAIARGEEGEQ